MKCSDCWEPGEKGYGAAQGDEGLEAGILGCPECCSSGHLKERVSGCPGVLGNRGMYRDVQDAGN